MMEEELRLIDRHTGILRWNRRAAYVLIAFWVVDLFLVSHTHQWFLFAVGVAGIAASGFIVRLMNICLKRMHETRALLTRAMTPGFGIEVKGERVSIIDPIE